MNTQVYAAGRFYHPQKLFNTYNGLILNVLYSWHTKCNVFN